MTLFKVLSTRARSFVICIVMLMGGFSEPVRADLATYSIDCWLNGDELRNRQGVAKYVSRMPDVFLVVDIEGKGRHLPAFIERQYKGQQLLITFQAPKPGIGDKLTVSFYRDRSTANHIWNKLASTPVHLRASGGVGTVQVAADWTFQLADQKLALVPPDFIAQAVLRYPTNMGYKLHDAATGITHGEVNVSIR